MAVFQRLLKGLDCPFLNDVNDGSISSFSQQEMIINWLEDRKIREYDIDARSVLRIQSNSIQSWSHHINVYIHALGCPYDWVPQQGNTFPEPNQQCLYWLLSFAISLDYEDTFNQDKSDADATEVIQSVAAQQRSSSGKSEYEAVAEKCVELGNMLGVLQKKDETLLEFVRRIVQKIKFCKIVNSNKTVINLNLEDFPLAQDTNDEIVNKIALVLRMLYLSDFRELQNEVNDLIVLGQEYTANPRLNASLGKVGR